MSAHTVVARYARIELLVLDELAYVPLAAADAELLSARLWGQSLVGHTNSVTSVAFSPDGKMMASGSDDKTVILWDVARHVPLATLTGHAGPVEGVAFSPDGDILASVSADRTGIFWEGNAAMARQRVCERVARDLIKDEWAQFQHGRPYRST